MGKTAKITGQVKGIPTPTLTWTKDGEPLEAGGRVKIECKKSGNLTLSISKVVESDFADYRVTAVNVSGETSACVTLSLTQEPPVVVQALSPSTSIPEDEPLVLVAQITGSPLPEFKWYKDMEEVVPDDRLTVEVLTDGTVTLCIAIARPEDCGNYKLVATNASGTVATQSAVDVQRLPKKPAFENSLPEEVKVTQGQPLKLSAKIVAYPPPEIRWMKDGRPLRPGSHVSISSLPDGNLALEIDCVKPEDAGRYSLLLSNELGELSADICVEVEPTPAAPQFTAPLSTAKAPEGFPIAMVAKVSGYPIPEISWLKDGEPMEADMVRAVAPSQPDADGTVRFKIRESLASDDGEYTAVATNSQGTSQSSAKMNIRPRFNEALPPSEPVFVSEPRDVRADEGSPIKLTAVIGGNPTPDIIITCNDEVVDPDRVELSFDGEKMAVEIAKAEKRDEGDYKIALKNELGERSAEAKVSVRKIYQSPSFTQKFSDVQQLFTYDAKFVAKVAGLPKPTVTWAFNGSEIKDSDKYRIKRDADLCVLFIRNCAAEDSGSYSCIASNLEGN